MRDAGARDGGVRESGVYPLAVPRTLWRDDANHPNVVAMPSALDAVRAALSDRYRIERELGAGGMATVYLAEDLRHPRRVAIKVLHPELTASLGTERFQREIGFAASLSHPHILSLHDSGEAAGFLFYVMPYVEGVSLRQELVRARVLAIADAVRILRDIADALAHAHAARVVHRDIKPENVMLSGRHAVVMDFGVAKSLAPREAVGSSTLTGTGVAMGTVVYMAPEQVAGDDRADQRVDIYAWGVLAYEVLTGAPTFVRDTLQAVMAAHMIDAPIPIATRRAEITPALAQIVMRCLAKQPADRFQSGAELLAAMESLTSSGGGVAAMLHRMSRSARMAAAAGVFLLGTGAVLAWRDWSEKQWVRVEATPLIQQLFENGQSDSAYALATRALATLPEDSALLVVVDRWTDPWLFCTEPVGAQVFRAPYPDTTRWQLLGTTPTDTISLPAGTSRIRFERTGYRPREMMAFAFPVNVDLAPDSTYLDMRSGFNGNHWCGEAAVSLDRIDSPDAGMIQIAAAMQWVDYVDLFRVFSDSGLPLQGYRIARHEATNREYRAFVAAGGYSDSIYWDHGFVYRGREVPWTDGVRLLVDRTKRPGPATWEGGDLIPGTEDLPVGGLSWYEAAAYANFAKRSLPTLYHWAGAAGINVTAWPHTVDESNMDAAGPRVASQGSGMSPVGAFDMAGNVREWALNPASRGNRYILGGGWSDPTFAFGETAVLDPFDRSAINGVRLADIPTDDPNLARASRLIVRPTNRDRVRDRPVSDESFRGYLPIYEYDSAPLNSVVVAIDSTDRDWTVEKVSFDAAYGNETVTAYLFLPRVRRGPLQTVVYFTGSASLYLRSSTRLHAEQIGFLVRSGRAVLWPVYKGMYERGDGISAYPDQSVNYRDHAVWWVKDTRRSVDYLMTRPDIDSSRLAYFGLSWGAAIGPLHLAVEPRLKVGVFYVGGLTPDRARPEVEVLNFLPRVTVPLLLIGGRTDPYFPVESSQRPLFDNLGTKAADKRHVIAEGSHYAPRAQLIAETLGWLDRYLGVPR